MANQHKVQAKPGYHGELPVNKIISVPYNMDAQPDEPKEILLRDNHPLLERFQATLKAHLLRVQEKLVEECLELDNSLKNHEEEQREVGSNLYDVQQQLKYQRRQLAEQEEEIKIRSQKREETDEQVKVARDAAESVQNKHTTITQKYQANLVTLENLNHFGNHIQKWHEEAENSLKVANRITKKDSQDKLAKIEEKRKLDLFILSLEAEVRLRENELNTINDQIRESTTVLQKFNKNLTDANADLEALQHEQKRLMQAWGEVIISIQQRDKMLAAVNEELHQEYEKHKDLKGHIEGTRKEIQKQTVQNEKLEGFLNRLTGDFQSLERQFTKENKEMERVMDAFHKKMEIFEQTEIDLKRAELEGMIIENQLKSVKTKIELQAKQKLEFEEKILDLLQEQISSDKAGQFRAKRLRENQDTRRYMEIQLSATENDLSKILLDLEQIRGSVTRYKEMQDKFQKDDDEMKMILSKQDDDLRGTITQINLRQKTLDLTNKQLDDAVASLGGREVSPEENRILELKQDLISLDKQMVETQNFWMKMQHHLSNLNEKRSQQTNDIYIARKQDLIIEQKYRKIERELNEHSIEEDKICREMELLNTRIQLMGTQVFSKQLRNNEKEAECNHNFDQFYEQLKSSEKNVLVLDGEIHSMEQELDTLQNSVVEKNREIFSWDGKYKTIVDVKRYQDEEAAVNGEINCMKMEIHRMEIRHAQLKRAQEKLMQDLDNCVIHREKIFNQSLVRNKVPIVRNRRSNLEEKIADFKEKIRQINQDAMIMERSIQELTVRQKELEGELRRKTYEIESEKQKDEQIRLEIDEGQVLRHANLEAIVKCQRRVKRYKAILMNTYPPKCRSEASIDNRLERQSEIQEQLTTFMDILINDFPDQRLAITRILQTLKET